MGGRDANGPRAAQPPPHPRGAFTVLLGGVLVTLGLVGLGRFAGPTVIAVQAATLVYAIWTAGGRSRLAAAAAIMLAALTAVLVVIDLAAHGHPGRLGTALTSGAGALLAGGTIVVILARIRTRPTVTIATVSAALSVYLLIGLGYAYVYDFIDTVGTGPFFHGDVTGEQLDYLYFSIITMATVGYGDLVPAGSLGRMVAATEAITGQLYLVTVVAMVVSNFAMRMGHLVAQERTTGTPGAAGGPAGNGPVGGGSAVDGDRPT